MSCLTESPESVSVKEPDELKPTVSKEIRMSNLKENVGQPTKKRVTFSEELAQETKISDNGVIEKAVHSGRSVLTAIDTRERKGLRF